MGPWRDTQCAECLGLFADWGKMASPDPRDQSEPFQKIHLARALRVVIGPRSNVRRSGCKSELAINAVRSISSKLLTPKRVEVPPAPSPVIVTPRRRISI